MALSIDFVKERHLNHYFGLGSQVPMYRVSLEMMTVTVSDDFGDTHPQIKTL
jgi:hypothetical protein